MSRSILFRSASESQDISGRKILRQERVLTKSPSRNAAPRRPLTRSGRVLIGTLRCKIVCGVLNRILFRGLYFLSVKDWVRIYLSNVVSCAAIASRSFETT